MVRQQERCRRHDGRRSPPRRCARDRLVNEIDLEQARWYALRSPASRESSPRTSRAAVSGGPTESLWWALPTRECLQNAFSQRLGANSSAPRRTAELAPRRKKPFLIVRESLYF